VHTTFLIRTSIKTKTNISHITHQTALFFAQLIPTTTTNVMDLKKSKKAK
jgi:hypothetical protein